MREQKKQRTDEELDEAARLKAIFVKQGHTQYAFAKENGFAGGKYGQQVIAQYLNGNIALNVDAAARFSRGLFCDISDFSPRLASYLESIGLTQHRSTLPLEAQFTANERRLVELYRALGKEGKALLTFWADSYLSKQPVAQPLIEESPPKSVFASLLDNPIITPESPKAPNSRSPTVGEGKADKYRRGVDQDVEGRRRKQKRVG